MSDTSTVLVGAKIFTGDRFLHDHAVVMKGDRIERVIPACEITSDQESIDLGGGILAPGFIDLQVNGGGGAFFTNETTVDSLARMLDGHRPTGTTSMMPTMISDTRETHQAGVQAVADAVEQGMKGILGVHIEGPFFSVEKRGAHNEKYIREMENDDISWISGIKGFKVMVTLAPEKAKAGQIKSLADAGVVVCAGHTNGEYDDIVTGIEEGLQGFTHLYNAMSPQTGREPGVVGAALSSKTTWCGLIADNHHVHKGSILVALAAKPQGKLYLVSDAMSTVGSDEKSFTIYGEEIFEKDGALVNAEGRLAGSAIGMIDAVRIMHKDVGISLEEALRMAALYPAEFMQLESELGRVKAGHRADLVHFNEEFVVQHTWVAGDHQAH